MRNEAYTLDVRADQKEIRYSQLVDATRVRWSHKDPSRLYAPHQGGAVFFICERLFTEV